MLFLNQESPLSDQLPPSIPIQLKLHQRTSVHACKRLETEFINTNELFDTNESESLFGGLDGCIRTRVGIMGDRVGSGKSYTILAIIYFAKYNQIHAPSYVNGHERFGGMCKIQTFANDNLMIILDSLPVTIRVNIIVIPHNLTAQWTGYLKNFNPHLNSYVISRNKHFDSLDEILLTLDVIVVTNTFYNTLALYIKRNGAKVDRVFIDEADTIHIVGNNNISAGFYWYVTASYKNLIGPYAHPKSTIVQNTFDPYTSSIRRRVAVGVVVSNEDDFITQSFEYPDMVVHNIVCKSPNSINILSGMVDQNIIACLNVGDVPSAIEFINPSRKSSEDNIITVLIDKHMRDLKNTELRLALIPTLDFNSEADKKHEFSKLTKRKTDIETSIELIRERIRNTDTCCICYDTINIKSVVPCCSNSYCFSCVCRWLVDKSLTCPLCKSKIDTSDVYVVQQETHETFTKVDDIKNKLDTIEDLVSGILQSPALTDNQNKRVLIFSSHEFAFSGITERLGGLNIKYSLLRGNHNVINSVVDKYISGEVPVLLVNPVHYGCGLNFEMTTDVIMYHQVDKELHDQVIGRAMRMGRKSQLNVWNLCHANEVQATT